VQGLLVREVFDHWERGDLVLMGWGAIGMIPIPQIEVASRNGTLQEDVRMSQGTGLLFQGGKEALPHPLVQDFWDDIAQHDFGVTVRFVQIVPVLILNNFNGWWWAKIIALAEWPGQAV
jgi:hypothetical protein